jgi:hypothetical protein
LDHNTKYNNLYRDHHIADHPAKTPGSPNYSQVNAAVAHRADATITNLLEQLPNFEPRHTDHGYFGCTQYDPAQLQKLLKEALGQLA